MTPSQPNNVDSGAHQTTWLHIKVLKREIKEDLQRGGLTFREGRANQSADSFLKEMKARAQLRGEIEQRSKETKQHQLKMVEENAEEYRKRLRGYMRPELLDD